VSGFGHSPLELVDLIEQSALGAGVGRRSEPCKVGNGGLDLSCERQPGGNLGALGHQPVPGLARSAGELSVDVSQPGLKRGDALVETIQDLILTAIRGRRDAGTGGRGSRRIGQGCRRARKIERQTQRRNRRKLKSLAQRGVARQIAFLLDRLNASKPVDGPFEMADDLVGRQRRLLRLRANNQDGERTK
jgi:hypothetical protein